MYRAREKQMSIYDYLPPYRGELCNANRWVRLADAIDWDGFEKAVVFNMVAKLPPGEHQTVVCRRFERDGVRHDALCLARMRRAAAAFAFRFLRARQEDPDYPRDVLIRLRVGEQNSKEREVEIQHKAGGKAVLSPELVAQPAVNGLEARFVLLAEVRLGRPDVTKHALEKTHDGERQLAVFLRAAVADDRGDDAD